MLLEARQRGHEIYTLTPAGHEALIDWLLGSSLTIGVTLAPPPLRDEDAHDRSSEHELHVRRERAGPMPAPATVEQLSAAGSECRKDVLEIGRRRRQPAERRAVERPASCRQQTEARDSARDLEAAAGDVLMGDPVAQEMRRRTEQQRAHA